MSGRAVWDRDLPVEARDRASNARWVLGRVLPETLEHVARSGWSVASEVRYECPTGRYPDPGEVAAGARLELARGGRAPSLVVRVTVSGEGHPEARVSAPALGYLSYGWGLNHADFLPAVAGRDDEELPSFTPNDVVRRVIEAARSEGAAPHLSRTAGAWYVVRGFHEVSEDDLVRDLALLEDLAAGVPWEWAARRVAGPAASE